VTAKCKQTYPKGKETYPVGFLRGRGISHPIPTPIFRSVLLNQVLLALHVLVLSVALPLFTDRPNLLYT